MSDAERIRAWCAESDMDCRVDDDAGSLLVLLDADVGYVVRLELPRDSEPLRLHDRVKLPEAAGLSADRFAEVVEDVVLGRSSLVDARPSMDPPGAHVVVVVYPDGLSRHTFLEATLEIQKIRLLLHREVDAAVAAERTVAALETLADEVWSTAPEAAPPEDIAPTAEKPDNGRRHRGRRRARSA